HLAVPLPVGGAGEVEVVEAQVEAEHVGGRPQRPEPFGDDFGADAVAGDDGDPVRVSVHELSSRLRSAARPPWASSMTSRSAVAESPSRRARTRARWPA